MILAYFSIAILFAAGGAQIKDMTSFLITVFEEDTSLMITQVISLLLSCALSILQIFTAISLGQLVRDHRIIASLAFYTALYTVQQIVSIVVLLPFMLSGIRKDLSAEIDTFSTGLQSSTPTMSVLFLSIILSVVFSIAFFFLSKFILKKKLNLL